MGGAVVACPRCGKRKIRKSQKYGWRKCRRCGVLGGMLRMDRSGAPTIEIEAPQFVCATIGEDFHRQPRRMKCQVTQALQGREIR